jgi:N-acetylmuramic acid 6-phosphate etherase
LPVGPMALSGSTRLQAASAQMFAVGMALLQDFTLIDSFLEEYPKLDLASFLVPVIEWEARAYARDEFVLYWTSTFPIAVLTDTTERAPTFSLAPFEKANDVIPPFSLCYLSIPDAENPIDAWRKILGRDPIGLDWTDVSKKLDLDSILEFNFGRDAGAIRAKKIKPRLQVDLNLELTHDELHLQSDSFDLKLQSKLWEDPFTAQILIKLLLNTHSLMVMGKMKRYEGNVMTWVRPSNGKLVDRTCRYLHALIEKRGLKPVSEERLVSLIFELKPTLKNDESIIHKILDRLTEASI